MPANSMIRPAIAAALLAWTVDSTAATSCSMAVGPVVFGTYDVFSASNLDTDTPVVVSCSRDGGPQNITVSITISPGANGGSTAARKMKLGGGGDLLGYNLFQDAGRTVVWGAVPGLDAQTRFLSVPNKSSAQLNTTIFARIPAGQEIATGSYSDTIFVTVTP